MSFHEGSKYQEKREQMTEADIRKDLEVVKLREQVQKAMTESRNQIQLRHRSEVVGKLAELEDAHYVMTSEEGDEKHVQEVQAAIHALKWVLGLHQNLGWYYE